MKNVHKLTEGALFLAAFSILLLMTLYIPVLGVVTNLFIALPFLMFAAKNDRKSSFVFLIGALLIAFIIGTVMAIPLALLYGLTGIVMGAFIRERKSRVAGFIAGTIVFLVTTVAQYAVSVAFFEMDVIKETFQMFDESIDQSFQIMEKLGQPIDSQLVEQFDEGIQMLKTLVPSVFVMASFVMVFVIELVSFPIAKRFGIQVPPWKPFRELSLPRSLLWYYLLVLLVFLLLNPEQGTYWYTAFLNLSFILQLFIIIQGLSLVYFFSYEKGIPKFVPILITVFLPLLLYIVRILGIIDLGFNLRKWIMEKK